MRVFHGPWKFPISFQKNKYFQSCDFSWENYSMPAFSFKVQHFAIKDGTLPFMKIKIKMTDQEKIDKKLNQKQNTQINEILDLGLKEKFLLKQYNASETKLFIQDCQWIKGLTYRKGSFLILDKSIM